MSNKEQRSIEQVRQLLGALGFDRAPVLPESPPRLDVFPEVDNRRIAIEATDYHADRMSPGGSAIRRGEQLDVRAGPKGGKTKGPIYYSSSSFLFFFHYR